MQNNINYTYISRYMGQNQIKKPELLLPAGNMECLRAAVNNGADAVYLGLDKFNARISADNFNEKNIYFIVDYCHKHSVKVYVTLNTLIKNKEIDDYFHLVAICNVAGVDAIIIQDVCFIPHIKKHFPKLSIHISTQATSTNSYAVPKEVDRVVLPRELSIEEITNISKEHDTEVFVHGALCLCYSGQCLFSSIAGGRSGNRGRCAQPCRQKYNNKYILSTKDLCLLSKLPELISTGVSSLKVEGRLRSPLYVATVAKIYKKYLNLAYDLVLTNTKIKSNTKSDPKLNPKSNTKPIFKINERDMDDLMIAFNREFTTGFAFNDSIVDSKMPMNRGLFLGIIKDGKIKLRKDLRIGDGVSIWVEEKGKDSIVHGNTIGYIKVNGNKTSFAKKDDLVEINLKKTKEGSSIYKTSSVDLVVDLGEEIISHDLGNLNLPNLSDLPDIKMDLESIENKDPPKLFVKVHSKKSAIEMDNEHADIIYLCIYNEACETVKNVLKNSLFFVSTPRIINDSELPFILDKIKKINPDGLLISNRGLLSYLLENYKELKQKKIHLDYSFNCFNDIDLDYYQQLIPNVKILPIISPELSLFELKKFKNKNFISFVHGDIILMTTKEKINAPDIVDEEGRHFKIIRRRGYTYILNNIPLGLFNKTNYLLDAGIKYFFLDLKKDDEKFIGIYKDILKGQFDDKKIRRKYTTGHFNRGVD